MDTQRSDTATLDWRNRVDTGNTQHIQKYTYIQTHVHKHAQNTQDAH